MTLCNVKIKVIKMTQAKSQLISIEELIKLFVEDRKEGKKELITWFLNNDSSIRASETILDMDSYPLFSMDFEKLLLLNDPSLRIIN